MEVARQRVRDATARKKEEERKAKRKDGTSSSTHKGITKGSTKRKGDEKDERPLKKTTVTLGDVHPKKKSTPKSVCGARKGMMTSSGPIIEGPRCLLTHKDYAIKEVGSLIKPTNIDPCAQLGTEKLGASALFDLIRASLLSWLIWSHLFLFIY